ncbi:hypothetical protein ILYODFUR_022842 [Ilyodon furcidens]|uniref:Uncharacterized protein n=1 Tax=Ilyodon furcidens TaxID=33524 RepID=A0ABV0UL81_9TELE
MSASYKLISVPQCKGVGSRVIRHIYCGTAATKKVRRKISGHTFISSLFSLHCSSFYTFPSKLSLICPPLPLFHPFFSFSSLSVSLCWPRYLTLIGYVGGGSASARPVTMATTALAGVAIRLYSLIPPPPKPTLLLLLFLLHLFSLSDIHTHTEYLPVKHSEWI